MSAVDRAQELLRTATISSRCGHDPLREDCAECDDWALKALPARRVIKRLGFTLDAFAVAVAMAKVLEELLAVTGESEGVAGWHLNGDIAGWGEFAFVSDVEEAVDGWEKIFAKEKKG